MRILRTPELRNGAKAGSLALVDDVTMLCPSVLPLFLPPRVSGWSQQASVLNSRPPNASQDQPGLCPPPMQLEQGFWLAGPLS